MSAFDVKAKEFLAQHNIAVVGVSRNGQEPANYIYKTLREKGYKVFPVNPNAETVEGDTCYSSVKALPEKVDGVVIFTVPAVTEKVTQECIEAGISRVWIHRNVLAGQGSMSEAAVKNCQEHGVEVIAGGCPMMFLEFGHKCMKFVLGVMGKLPN